MTTHLTEAQQRQRAAEKTALVADILKGSETGLTSEVEKISRDVESMLRVKEQQTGSKPIGHAAEVLEAQRKLIAEKNLADRFLRVAKRMDELRSMASSPGATQSMLNIQREIDSLRPLLRLIIRSEEFRDLLKEALKVSKNVLDRNYEDVKKGAKEKVGGDPIEKADEQGGMYVAEQMLEGAKETVEKKLDKDEDLMTDEEWDIISNRLDVLFNNLQRHREFRDGVNQLFDLGSSLKLQLQEQVPSGYRSTMESKALEEVKQETIGIVGQFSGEKEIYNLSDSINILLRKIETHEPAHEWWTQFKEHTLEITRNYKGKQDVEKYRELFQKGREVFKDFMNEINAVIDCLIVVMDNIANDYLLNDLREKVGNLSDDLYWKDENGNRVFDSDAAKTLASTISDAIKKEFKYLALPPVVFKEEGSTLVLENLIITATLPDAISFHLESFATLDIKTWDISLTGKPNMNTEIYLTATTKGITFCAPNVSFVYEGTISDSGVVSISVPEPGAELSIDFVIRPTEDNPKLVREREVDRKMREERMQQFGQREEKEVRIQGHGYSFVKVKAHFNVPTLRVNYDKSTITHDILLPFFTRVFKGQLVSSFEDMVEQFLNDGMRSLGEKVTTILTEAPNPLSLASFSQGIMGEGSFVE